MAQPVEQPLIAALDIGSSKVSAMISPDWKLRSQRRPPTQVAEASCG